MQAELWRLRLGIRAKKLVSSSLIGCMSRSYAGRDEVNPSRYSTPLLDGVRIRPALITSNSRLACSNCTLHVRGALAAFATLALI